MINVVDIYASSVHCVTVGLVRNGQCVLVAMTLAMTLALTCECSPSTPALHFPSVLISSGYWAQERSWEMLLHSTSEPP